MPTAPLNTMASDDWSQSEALKRRGCCGLNRICGPFTRGVARNLPSAFGIFCRADLLRIPGVFDKKNLTPSKLKVLMHLNNFPRIKYIKLGLLQCCVKKQAQIYLCIEFSIKNAYWYCIYDMWLVSFHKFALPSCSFSAQPAGYKSRRTIFLVMFAQPAVNRGWRTLVPYRSAQASF